MKIATSKLIQLAGAAVTAVNVAVAPGVCVSISKYVYRHAHRHAHRCVHINESTHMCTGMFIGIEMDRHV